MNRAIASVLLLILYLTIDCSFANGNYSSDDVVNHMQGAYSNIYDYTTNIIITGFGSDRSFKRTQRVLYTFKKPNKVRIDFESGHQGMVIVYPDQEGKVVVRLGSWFPFAALQFHLDESTVEISPGQHINQTDLGMLIRNISLTTTELRLGDLNLEDVGNRIVIRVLADNPFHRGATTHYTFSINKSNWLPEAVEEATPAGVLRRTVVYENLRTNTGVRDRVFQLNSDENG